MTAHEYPIEVPEEELSAFCRRNHICKLSLFGSVLRDDFGPASDIDVLVEFDPGATPGFGFVELLGRHVDLNTPGCLSKSFRDEVLYEAQVVYVAA